MGGTPKSSILNHFNRIFPYKPAIFGYHLWKPPYDTSRDSVSSAPGKLWICPFAIGGDYVHWPKTHVRRLDWNGGDQQQLDENSGWWTEPIHNAIFFGWDEHSFNNFHVHQHHHLAFDFLSAETKVLTVVPVPSRNHIFWWWLRRTWSPHGGYYHPGRGSAMWRQLLAADAGHGQRLPWFPRRSRWKKGIVW